MKQGLNGRGVLVVGGSNGPARIIALAAAGRGEHVVLCETPGAQEPVSAVVVEGHAAGAPESLSLLPADVSREDAVEHLLEQVLERLPSLDVLVAVFADATPPTPLHELSLASWDREVSGRLRGAFLLTRAAVSELLASGQGGRVVLVAPTVGAYGQACAVATQCALRSLGRSVAKEYGGRGITCNVILPHTDPQVRGHVALTEAVLFLASEKASYVSGACLRVGAPAGHRIPATR